MRAKIRCTLTNIRRCFILLIVIVAFSGIIVKFNLFDKVSFLKNQHKHDSNATILQARRNRFSAIDTYKRDGFTGYKQFFNYIENPLRHFCQNVREFGGVWTNSYGQPQHEFYEVFLPFNVMFFGWHFDGAKAVCLDERIFASKSENRICIVISIGIGKEWSFDDAIANYGCKVYAFDHTIHRNEHVRGENIHFYPYGIGQTEKMTKKGLLKTLASMFDLIKSDLNKTDIEIDYLKIDVEGHEMEFFEYIFFDAPKFLLKIKQIGMEIHPGKIDSHSYSSYRDYFDYFMKLETKGFKLFSSEMNPVYANRYYFRQLKRYINGFYELAWCK